MNDFYVYGLIDPFTKQCFYVGKGCKNRMYQHVKKVQRESTTENPHLDRKIAKILRNGGDVECVVFYDSLLEDAAFEKEDEKIRELGIENLCNVWYGGKGGRVPSDNVRKRISERRRGIAVSEETKQKLREAKLGTTQSEETKKKRSDALKGKSQTPEQKKANALRSRKMKGRKFSEKHKQKLREAKLKNPVRYWKGKTLPNEMKQKISESVKRTIGSTKDE